MAKKKAAAPAATEPQTATAPVAVPEQAQAPAAPETQAAAPAAPAAPAKPPRPAKVEQNGITKPGEGTTTGRIWAIADGISGTLKAPAPRADVMKQAEAEKINPATAATQYGKWRKFHGLKSEPKAPKAAAAPAATPEAPAPAAAPAQA